MHSLRQSAISRREQKASKAFFLSKGEKPTKAGLELFKAGYYKGFSGGGRNNHADRVCRKLSEKHVVEIWEDLQEPYVGIQRDLAEKYGVADSTISDIKKGRVWAHVTGANNGTNYRG